jgi:hypothetical protein
MRYPKATKEELTAPTAKFRVLGVDVRGESEAVGSRARISRKASPWGALDMQICGSLGFTIRPPTVAKNVRVTHRCDVPRVLWQMPRVKHHKAAALNCRSDHQHAACM